MSIYLFNSLPNLRASNRYSKNIFASWQHFLHFVYYIFHFSSTGLDKNYLTPSFRSLSFIPTFFCCTQAYAETFKHFKKYSEIVYTATWCFGLTSGFGLAQYCDFWGNTLLVATYILNSIVVSLFSFW